MAIQRFATSRSSWGWGCLATLALIACPTQADARQRPHLKIDISSLTLADAIAELAREANVSIGSQGSLPQLSTRPVRGRMSVAAALGRLLRKSGYTARQVGPTAWRIESIGAPSVEVPAVSDTTAATTPQFDTQDIVVTATKRDLTLQNAPVAATVVRVAPSRQLDPDRDTETVAHQVEGLTLTGQGPGRNRMFLRGIADSPFGGKTQSTVAVLLDDARLNYVAPDPDIRLVDVSSVEILKGPQGSLYGSGALGGIYRIVTNRADPTALSVSGSVNGRLVAGGEFGGGGSLVANIPLVTDVAARRLVGYGEQAPGWIDTGDRKDSNSSTVLGGRAELGVELGEEWRADATAFGQWLDARDSNYTYRPEAHERPAQFAEPHDNDLLHGSLRLAKDGNTQIVLSTGYTSHQVRDRYDATQGADSFGLADPQTLDDTTHYRVWDNEARLTGSWGRLGWLGGVSYVDARQHGLRVLNGFGGTSLTIETVDTRAEEAAVFGEATLPLGDDLDATLGGRVYRSVLRERRAFTAAKGHEGLVRTGVTPSAALAWHPTAHRMFYVRYGSAVRQAGTTVQADGTVQKLDGDELATAEAGWREEHGPYSFDLSAYHSWWNDVQSDVLLPNGLVETANVGRAAITGAELTAKAQLGKRWRLEAGAMAQSALLVRNETGLKLDDRRLPVVPEWTLRGMLAHDFPLGDWLATVSGDARYVGPSRLSFDPALDRPMGNYVQIDAALQATRGKWTVAIEGENLFDARGDSFAYGNPLRLMSTNQYVRQDPFDVKLSLILRP
jgi:outer membrane receptor protein involved in Fe transport